MKDLREVRRKMSFTDRIRIDNTKKKFGKYIVKDGLVKVTLTDRETPETNTIEWMRETFGMQNSIDGYTERITPKEQS